MAEQSNSSPGFFRSPIGRKIVSGVTGLGLVVFVIEHMSGNLALFSGSDAYNEYAHFLISLGAVLYILEAGLLAFFVFHIVSGISVWLKKRRARSKGYERYQSAGRPSMMSSSSRSMIITGGILFLFLIFHLYAFKFGPGGPGNADPAYVTSVDGVQMRDLSKLVHEKFSHASYAFGYTVIMLLLAVHLRHGVWSAFQSLGAMRPSMKIPVYIIGGVLGLLIALGFIAVPLSIYFGLI
jgi:succinate dehydrogenase / fumarate reductase cytochrome b subunit